ncbi:hypothetical protein [Octadecabacter antarcticus]|uniref:hypothetical protein n=1 Tax=Octadecabacter antarcticus TaxID=1217908 RepID=UPI0011817F16|nr:hypothetical protein [Octadecabacter antarcticus]
MNDPILSFNDVRRSQMDGDENPARLPVCDQRCSNIQRSGAPVQGRQRCRSKKRRDDPSRINFADMLSVKENTFMGREVRRGILLDKKAMQAKTRVLLEQLNCSAPATARIDTLLNSYKKNGRNHQSTVTPCQSTGFR